MQGLVRGVKCCKETLRVAILKHSHFAGRDTVEGRNMFSRFGCIISSPPMQEKGLENLTVADVLMTKGEEKTGTWLWCHTNDTVDDAVKNVGFKNISKIKFSLSC